MVPRLEPAGLFALALLSIIWAWWGAKEGAFFEVVLLPGTIVLCLGAALLAGFAPWRAKLSLSRGTTLCLVALVALGLWAALSALWSPAPDIAVGDGQRILVYALAFGLGVWLCTLLGERMELSLVPLTVAALFAGLVTIIALVSSETPKEVLEIDGTLDYPLGYRNATAAFFAIALFPAVSLASRRELDWRLRGLALAATTLCVDFFLLAQSRGSAPALLVALIVFLFASPYRVRIASWLALAIVPALGIVPAATDLYAVANDEGVRNSAEAMHTAGYAVAVTALAALAIGALAARFEARLPGLGSDSARGNRAVALLVAGAMLVGGAGFVAAVGDPVDWIGQRADEFKSGGTPDLGQQASRFSLNAGSDRYDLWRVALDDFTDDPLLGKGGGGFQYTYLEKREVVYQNAHDAHSVELETLAEFGLPGLILLLCAIGGATVGIVRARWLGPSAAGLSAAALASGTYWLAHASIDWFWPYPGVTAPVWALLGAACGPAVVTIGARARARWRPALIAAVAILAVTCVPPWLSERFVENASRTWRDDPERAFDELDSAAQLNPLSDWPLLVEGQIAKQLGDTERAIDAFARAAEKRPEEYAAHYRLAELLFETDPERAREEVGIALELNPIDTTVRRLATKFGVEPAPLPE